MLKTDSFLEDTQGLREQFDKDKKAEKPYTEPFTGSAEFATHVLEKQITERMENGKPKK